MSRLTAAVLLSCCVTAPRSAEAAPGAGYAIASGKDRIEVRQGKRRATLVQDAQVGEDLRDDKRARVVTFTRTSECRPGAAERFTYDQLEARLVNTEALALHRKGDYAAAAKGFAEAVHLDPTWVTPAYNLACARTKLGALEDALAALAPWLAAAPVTTYVHVAADVELRPLLATPVLRKLRAQQPGALVADQKTLADWMFAPERRLVASISIGERSTGLTVYDAASGAELAAAAFADRAVAADVVVALGLLATPVEGDVARERSETDARKVVRLARAKLAFIESGSSRVNVLRGEQQVGSGVIYERFNSASYLSAAKVAVLDSYRPSDLCADGKTTVVPIKD